ncbi:MAG: LytTR family DNA-binding domain-containing protein [Gammaproteobacteria bacterium]|nr:LytTR family DNA-binding domain-containing protein [Gammaproteobacteria bacterium]
MNPTVLIADDEPLLRDQLDRLVSRLWPQASVVAFAANGEEARLALREKQPDVAFLDIRMPSPDGLELAEEFGDTSTLIVFVTAYDQYAVTAFEKNACDYLLKPITEDRFTATVNRLRERLQASDTEHFVASIRREIDDLKQRRQLERIPVRHRGETRLVSVNDIRFFKTEAKYTLAFDAVNEYVLSTPLRELEEQLDDELFWRIHRNCIVNADFIETVQRRSNDTMVVHVMDRNEELKVSRNHRHRFREF